MASFFESRLWVMTNSFVVHIQFLGTARTIFQSNFCLLNKFNNFSIVFFSTKKELLYCQLSMLSISTQDKINTDVIENCLDYSLWRFIVKSATLPKVNALYPYLPELLLFQYIVDATGNTGYLTKYEDV